MMSPRLALAPLAGLATLLLAACAGDAPSVPAPRAASVAAASAELATDETRPEPTSGEPGRTTPKLGDTAIARPVVSSGRSRQCALDARGRIACLGAPLRGQFPTPPSGTWYTQVAAGGHLDCALRSDRRIVCLRDEVVGSLSTDSGTFASAVAYIAPPVDAGYVQLAVGAMQACAVREHGGGVRCWGLQSYPGVTVDPPAPPAGVVYTQVSVGPAHACALRSDGQATCWSAPVTVVLAIGGVPISSLGFAPAPLPATPARAPYVQVAAGDRISCGLRGDGGIVCSGYGPDTRPLTYYANDVPPPPPVIALAVPALPAGVTYRSVSLSAAGETRYAAPGHGCATRSDGRAVCWTFSRTGAPTVTHEEPSIRQVVAGAGSAIEGLVSLGADCGLRDDGLTACWDEGPATVRDRRAAQLVRVLSTIPTSAVVGGQLALDVRATSGLPARVASRTPAVCTAGSARGTGIVLVGAGKCALVAGQPGDPDFAPAPEVVLPVFTVVAGRAP